MLFGIEPDQWLTIGKAAVSIFSTVLDVLPIFS